MNKCDLEEMRQVAIEAFLKEAEKPWKRDGSRFVRGRMQLTVHKHERAYLDVGREYIGPLTGAALKAALALCAKVEQEYRERELRKRCEDLQTALFGNAFTRAWRRVKHWLWCIVTE